MEFRGVRFGRFRAQGLGFRAQVGSGSFAGLRDFGGFQVPGFKC